MLSIQVKGLTATVKYTELLQHRARDFRPYFNKTLVPMLTREIRSIFRERGPGWPPLKPATIAEKKRLGYPLDPLIRTGRYYREATNVRAAKITPGTLRHTIRVPYAVYHEYGTRRMPARPVLGKVLPRILPELEKTMTKFILDGTYG